MKEIFLNILYDTSQSAKYKQGNNRIKIYDKRYRKE